MYMYKLYAYIRTSLILLLLSLSSLSLILYPVQIIFLGKITDELFVKVLEVRRIQGNANVGCMRCQTRQLFSFYPLVGIGWDGPLPSSMVDYVYCTGCIQPPLWFCTLHALPCIMAENCCSFCLTWQSAAVDESFSPCSKSSLTSPIPMSS